MMDTITAVSAPSDLCASDKHCVFRTETMWFSVPAVSVREITIAPILVEVPSCRPLLDGLCHLRSEFVPVVSLASVLGVATRIDSIPTKLIVMAGSNRWGLLVEEAAAIESLETIISPDSRGDDSGRSPIIGTAMFHERIVRVLDPNCVYRIARQGFDSLWNQSNHQILPTEIDTGNER